MLSDQDELSEVEDSEFSILDQELDNDEIIDLM